LRFPQTFIDDLKRQTDIVRIIQDYVSLKKKGANWMACCPFHQEKTPSFSVSPAKEIFYCFGCQKGGSVFNFVMEIERVNFPEAVKIVAQKTGIPLPAMEEDKRFAAQRNDANEIIQLNTWALEWWESQSEGGGAEARTAREYLSGRGISEETRKTFRLGYAPDSWDALSSQLRQRGASADQIERSGLVVRKDNGGFYDRFRKRIIFPVMDSQGRPVAFGGRAPGPDGEPKYLNSPETAAYIKGRHLYGLNVTRDEIRRKRFAILVEGYFDLLIPFQFGIRNVVASLGTALTPEQAKLMARFARKVIVNYDGDKAGVQAARRAIETLLAEDFEVKLLVLPDNADPDEFIRTNGAEAYHERRSKALIHIQFVIDQAVRDRNLLRPAEKAAAVEEVLPYVRAVRNAIQKRDYFDQAMDALHVDEPALRRDLWQSLRKGGAAAVGQKMAQAMTAKPTVAEQRLLELLFTDADLRRAVLPHIEASDFQDLPTAAVFRALLELTSEGAEIDFAGLSAKTEGDELAADLVPLLLMSEPQRAHDEAMDDVMAIAEGCLAALRLMKIDRRIGELHVELAAAEREGDGDRRDRLATEHVECARLRNTLLPQVEAVPPGVSRNY
jgi:DNA primase